MQKNDDAKQILRLIFECRKSGYINSNSHNFDGEKAVLLFLFEKDCAVASGTLSQQFGISTARVAKLTKTLRQKGLVNIVVDDGDARKTLMSLSQKGKLCVQNHRDKLLKVLTEFLQYIGNDEVEHLKIIFKKFAEFSMQKGEGNV